MKHILTCVALVLVASLTAIGSDKEVSAFLTNHCVQCHGAKTQKADRRFDRLPTTIAKLDDLERYQEIVDQLNLGTMPPEGAKQPSPEQRARIITFLTQKLESARSNFKSSHGQS